MLLHRFWARSVAVTTSQPWAARSERRWAQAVTRPAHADSESPRLEVCVDQTCTRCLTMFRMKSIKHME